MTLSFAAYQYICTAYREIPGCAPDGFILTLPGTYRRRSYGFLLYSWDEEGAPDAVFSGTLCPFTDIFVSEETPASAHILHAGLHTPDPDPFFSELEAARNVCAPCPAKSPSKFSAEVFV